MAKRRSGAVELRAIERLGRAARSWKGGFVGELTFEVHFGSDLVENDVCDLLQGWLRDRTPRFASDLRALSYERDPEAVPIDVSVKASLHQAMLDRGLRRGSLFDALSAETPGPPARRFGEVSLRGKAAKTNLSLGFDQFCPAKPIGERWLWSNSVAGSTGARSIDRMAAADWVSDLLGTFVDHPALLWGAAYSTDEWYDRNMHDEADGMWALGRNVRQSLPGLFWLNVFGKPYVEHMGRDRVLTVPAAQVTSAGAAVVVRLYDDPEGWSADDSQTDHDLATAHLGGEHFFDRRIPDRRCSAPDLGLADLTGNNRSLQAFTEDGEHLTVLPPAY